MPMAGEALPGTTMMLEVGAEEGAPEVSSAEAAMGQVSASTLPAPSAVGGATSEELPLPEGSASVGVGVELS